MLSRVRDVLVSCSALLLVVVAFYFVQFRFRPQAQLDLADEASRLLEVVNAEGFIPADLDYQDPVLNQRKVFLTTDLDERTAERVMRQLAYLDARDPGKPIDLFIDTAGGTGGIMLASFLRTLSSPVNTTALDFCASAGAEVLAAGTGTRSAFLASRIILHMVVEEDYPEDHPEYSFQALKERVSAAFWQTHSSLPREYWAVTEELYINLDSGQALAFGVIDRVID